MSYRLRVDYLIISLLLVGIVSVNAGIGYTTIALDATRLESIGLNACLSVYHSISLFILNLCYFVSFCSIVIVA